MVAMKISYASAVKTFRIRQGVGNTAYGTAYIANTAVPHPAIFRKAMQRPSARAGRPMCSRGPNLRFSCHNGILYDYSQSSLLLQA